MHGLVRVKPIVLDYAPRRQFLPFHDRTARWAILVCHRRAGKTVATLNDIIKRAITENKPEGRYAFVFPQRNQAKDTAWKYLKRFAAPLLGAAPNESELRIDLLNGSMIRLYGSDNPDALRGPYLDGVVLDEFAQQDSSIWGEVIRPMLADRLGWTVFIGTPKGKNAFFKLWEAALKSDRWYAFMLKASESGLLSADELEEIRQDENISDDQYMQEFECSFSAAIKGAFYADELRTAEAEGRIRPIEIIKDIRVHTGWDIGRTDSTAIWFIQCVGRERRLVDYYELSGKIITYYADVLYEKKREHGWTYGEHFAPHDMAYHMLDAEKSRKQMMLEKGVDFQIIPQHDVLEGVDVVRKMLGRTYIDPVRCERGLEALRQYRRQWDDKLKDWKPGEHVDWTNHGADALRTFAVGFDDPTPIVPKSDRRRRERDSEVSSWAA